jgi:hypothetical protein
MPRKKKPALEEKNFTTREVTRAAVVACVLSKVGARYAEQGRTMTIGYDCIGLFTSTGQETGCHSFEFMGYPNNPDGETFERLCDEKLIRLADDWRSVDLRPADLLAFDRGKGLQHLAMVVGVYDLRRRRYEICDATRELGGVRRYPFLHPFTKAKRIVPYRLAGLID